MIAPEKKAHTASLLRRLLRLRERFHALRAQYRSLQERQMRSFQRRLDWLQQELNQQVRHEEFAKPLDEYTRDFMRRAIMLAIEHSDGDLADAAMLLGMSFDELQAMLEENALIDEGDR